MPIRLNAKCSLLLSYFNQNCNVEYNVGTLPTTKFYEIPFHGC
jgi:hypothetical protein